MYTVGNSVIRIGNMSYQVIQSRFILTTENPHILACEIHAKVVLQDDNYFYFCVPIEDAEVIEMIEDEPVTPITVLNCTVLETVIEVEPEQENTVFEIGEAVSDSDIDNTKVD